MNTSASAFINGKWITPNGEADFHNINPMDKSDVIDSYRLVATEEVAMAVEAAKKASPSWGAVPAPERGRYLSKVAEQVRENSEDIAHVLSKEQGKVLEEARGEVLRGLYLLEYYSGAGFRLKGDTLPTESKNNVAFRPLLNTPSSKPITPMTPQITKISVRTGFALAASISEFGIDSDT